MVAVIHHSKSLRRAINYNEQKVTAQQATCLLAVNYPKSTEELTVYQKLNRLVYQAALNERTKVNGLHISLNFDPSEKLTKEKLIAIAQTYMDRIGFGGQPYLVYEHRDAAHPHLHLVTTNIQSDGKRIQLHNLGKRLSEPARKEIEQAFGLAVAGRKQLQQVYSLQPVKIIYGKTDIKRAITNVLDHVVPKYKYTSLEELNAVLKGYNVIADRGEPGSRTHQRNGLVYRVLDARGHKVGAPVKASLIYSKPTMKALASRYDQNALDRKPHRQRIRTLIDWTLYGRALTLPQWIGRLKSENVQVVVRQNKEGVIYGLTYVDHRTKCVFNGSDLGKEYSAKAVLSRCQPDTVHRIGRDQYPQQEETAHISGAVCQLVEVLLVPVYTAEPVPGELKETARKKKRKRLKP